MVSTIYFNGLKMYTELHDTPNGLNKWFAGGKWFLGKSVKIQKVCFMKVSFLSVYDVHKLSRGQLLLIVIFVALQRSV